jgi:hypothetical protein
MQIETQNIVFSNESQKSVSFSVSFLGIPAVSAVSINQNVELYLSNLTTSGFTLNSSSPFTGNVKIIATRG